MKFNSIQALTDISQYDANDSFLNFQIDGNWLDELLDEYYPGQDIKGLEPSLNWMHDENDSKVVWKRIMPEVGVKTICPILMCPDDRDFWCTLIVCEIENTGSVIKWNKFGFDKSEVQNPENVGSNVFWCEESELFQFDLEDYKKMVNDFRLDLEKD